MLSELSLALHCHKWGCPHAPSWDSHKAHFLTFFSLLCTTFSWDPTKSSRIHELASEVNLSFLTLPEIRFTPLFSANHEAEQQIKFFQSRVAAAFSERDRALMEVVKTHQSKAEMSDKLNQLHNRSVGKAVSSENTKESHRAW
eukprot:Gb_02759 [translate_table: standard]